MTIIANMLILAIAKLTQTATTMGWYIARYMLTGPVAAAPLDCRLPPGQAPTVS